MSETGNYFQFPICLLARDAEHRDVLDVAIDYSIMQFVEGETEDTYDNLYQRGKIETAYRAAMKKMCLKGGSPDRAQKNRLIAEKWIGEHYKLFGTDASVRIKTEIAFASRDGSGLPRRDFRVLAAIYSVIGNKPFARIATSWIEHRTAGCKSKEVFDKWPDRGEAFTPKEIRGSVERLHDEGKGYFARSTFNRSETYYSHRLNGPKLREAIANLKLQIPAQRSAERVADDENNAMIARELKARKGQPVGNLQAT